MDLPRFDVDMAYVQARLLKMLAIPSPTGLTNELSRLMCAELEELEVDYKLTRRGTIIATIPGAERSASRAIVNHLDTIGAVVSELKPNGRLGLTAVGTWSSRFAEGGKVTVFTHERAYRGQVLPLLASGHAFNERIDTLPIGWDQIELRLNEPVHSRDDLVALGIRSGDFVAFDSSPEISESGYVCARHLDNKAGASALLGALKMIKESGQPPAIDLQAIFTVTEEVGMGAGSSLSSDVIEFVGIDIGPVAPGQNARETGVTLCAQDTSGPFDYHMLQKLKGLCRKYSIAHQIDVFRYYYSDANSAVRAGHDVRDALITFGTDATHGYERTHLNSLESIAALVYVYAFSKPVYPLLEEDRVTRFPHVIAG
ncbi:MAG: osmoprotectant NAGGN system M42 family peptidase [Gammaproteobacteria bacterium]|nr:osmoprotectant NAGGN system M42 family peptidase [Gammaproteobacteria bacterium]